MMTHLAHSSNTNNSDTIRVPRPVIHGLTGIVNTANTCYMNSAIQLLSHINPLTRYLLEHKEEIYKTLEHNAKKIFKDSINFGVECATSNVSIELRRKIQDPEYNSSMLTADEKTFIYNNTITAQLIRLLENMWAKNCVIIPTSFRYTFSEARNKFFHGCEQHDAEEAYSCILQKLQEELSEEHNVTIKTNNTAILDYARFKNDIDAKIQKTNDIEIKQQLINFYNQKKREMPMESLVVESHGEMIKYYGTTYGRVTDIFSGFLHSSMSCPDPNCNYSSNKFDPYLHLSLPLPPPIYIRPMGESIGSTNSTGSNGSTNSIGSNGLTSSIGSIGSNGLTSSTGLYGLNGLTGSTSPYNFMGINNGLRYKSLTIDDCLHEYCKTEMLDEQNLWSCEGCHKKVRGIKRLQIWTSPPVLVIQLKRFGNERIRKDSRLVEYPMEHFNIGQLISRAYYDSRKCYEYRLQGVINHTGGLNGGHYFTYCKDEDSNNWYEFNDVHVTRIPIQKVVTPTAYILVYIRMDMFNY